MLFLLFQLLSLTGMTEANGSDTPVEVKFAFILPYGVAVQLAGEQVIVDTIKQLTPDFLPLRPVDINSVSIFDHNNNLGLALSISSLTPNIFDVLLEAKAFVACGSSISTDGALPIEYITVDDRYFEDVYSPGLDPVLTGDETISCPTTEGPETSAKPTTRKQLTRRPTQKPTAGTGQTSGMKALVTLTLLMVVLLVY